jgi:hypothetical protein
MSFASSKVWHAGRVAALGWMCVLLVKNLRTSLPRNSVPRVSTEAHESDTHVSFRRPGGEFGSDFA